MRRYNWHSAGYPGWPFPVLKCKHFFSNKTHGSNFIKQHSETTRYDTRCYFDVRAKADMNQLNLPHGNCCGWKLPECLKRFKKKHIFVSFVIIFGTLSFRVGRGRPTLYAGLTADDDED